MSQVLLQTNSNFATGIIGSYVATAGVGFPSTTTLGSLFLCKVWAGASDNSPNVPTAPTIALPVTAGVTWKLAGYAADTAVHIGLFGARGIGSCALFYALNTSPIVSSTHTLCTVTTGLATSSASISIQLSEVSGGLTTLAQVLTGTGFDSIPGSGNIAFNTNGCVFEVGSTGATDGGGADFSPGTGYTAETVVYSTNSQYMLNAASGTYPTAYGALTSGYWSTVAAAFSTAPVPRQITGGQFQDALGNPLAYGSVTFRLTSDANVSDSNIMAGILTTAMLGSNGSISGTVYLWPTDQLTPALTVYRIKAYTATGELAWQSENAIPSGAGAFDLGTLVPSY
jgi:hypothetical protein